ncbi:hypothetical protein B0J14DRAFT_284584 [Halenospora varia]|nr:hypothetical protein B0J14DRAFT_284584 [Halenospora varia]
MTYVSLLTRFSLRPSVSDSVSSPLVALAVTFLLLLFLLGPPVSDSVSLSGMPVMALSSFLRHSFSVLSALLECKNRI